MGRLASRNFALLSTLTLAVLGTLGTHTIARADEPGPRATPVAVLGIDSDDAEEQADALTSSLRSRIRAAPGWSLGDANQQLGMLTAALKCPQHPDGACEQRISEQIKNDNFVWGVMRKGPAGKVSVELHLYSKGKPSQVASSSYAENLKDQNDDSLRREAQGLISKLQGNVVGTITVHAGATEGEMIIDDARHEPLKGGNAHVDVAVGSHTVEVTAKGFPSQKTTLNVTAGHESLYEPSFSTAPVEAKKPFPTRKVVGGVVLAAGVGSAVASVVFGLQYKDIQDTQAGLLKSVPNGQSACDGKSPSDQTSNGNACGYRHNHEGTSTADSALAWTFGGVAAVGIGVGAYLLFTDGGAEKSDAPASQTGVLSNVRVLPNVGPGGGSVALSGAF